MTSLAFRKGFNTTTVNAIILPIKNSLHSENLSCQTRWKQCLWLPWFSQAKIYPYQVVFLIDASNCLDFFLYAVSTKSFLNTMYIQDFEILSSLGVFLMFLQGFCFAHFWMTFTNFPVRIFRNWPGTCLLEIIPVQLWYFQTLYTVVRDKLSHFWNVLDGNTNIFESKNLITFCLKRHFITNIV